MPIRPKTSAGGNKAGFKRRATARQLFMPGCEKGKLTPTATCMFQRLCTYFEDTGVLIFEGYVHSGHCSRQQISEKNEGYLLSEGYLFTVVPLDQSQCP